MVKNRYSGSHALADIAIRVLSQTTSASQCERNWSTFSLIHSKVRNRLKAERLEQLVYCHYNMRLRIKNMRLRQQLRDKRHAEEGLGDIDVEALFDDDNPLHSWVEAREDADEPVFNIEDRRWAEGILDEDEPRDPEFREPAKRARGESSTKGKEKVVGRQQEPEIEPARRSESDSMPVTPRMMKLPSDITRSSSMRDYDLVMRTSAAARDDPAIEQLKNIYVRRTPRGTKGSSQQQKKEEPPPPKAKKQQKKSSKPPTRRLVTYASDDDNDDDDDTPSGGAGVGETAGGGIYGSQSQSQYEEESQGYYGTQSQGGQYEHDPHGHYGHHSGYGGYGGGQQGASMYGWNCEGEFQFQPFPATREASSSSSGFQASQQPNTPRGIQSGMNELATSLFGYSAYAGYMHPTYEYPGQHGEHEGEGSSGYWPQ